MRSNNILTFTLIGVHILLSITEHLRADVAFSHSVPEQLIFKRIPRISVHECFRECKARRRCKRAVYNRAAKVCSLTKEASSLTLLVSYGDNLLTGVDAERTIDPLCGGVECDELQTCVQEAGVSVCRITECSPVDSVFFTTHGNTFDVGSVILIVYLTGVRTTKTCDGDGNWVGDDPHGCCEAGCQSGVVVWPGNLSPYFCEMDTDGGQWMLDIIGYGCYSSSLNYLTCNVIARQVFQRRKDGSANFKRNWKAYVDGFGDLGNEFWLGLETMYTILSTGNFELRVDLEDFSGQTKYAKYSSFSIGEPADNYRLHVTGFQGNGGDSLAVHNGQQFSTYDNDNDIIVGNCADIYHGGWWYKNCHSSNLNGLYYNGGENTTEHATHIHWSTWQGYWFSLKSCEMKFRKLS